MLCFDLLTRPKMLFKVVHRKEVTHPGRWKSEEVAWALRRVYITAWEFEGNIRPTNWGQWEIGEKEGKQYSGRRKYTWCSRESKHTEEFTPGSVWATMENEKDITLTAITSGSKYFSNVRSPSTSHTQTWNNPFETYKLIWEVKYFIKMSSCVFLAFVVYSCNFIIVRLFDYLLCRYDAAWTCTCVYNHIYYVSI